MRIDAASTFWPKWIPNRLAQLIGPRLYGLPYRFGQLAYSNTHRVLRSGRQSLAFDMSVRERSRRDALSDFLVERYSAFTERHGIRRRFEIAHAPWKIFAAEVAIERSDLIENVVPDLAGAMPVGAHYSGGVRGVRISAPMRVHLASNTRSTNPVST